LKDIVLFLSAWFMISDSIATVSGTAVLFAKTELAMAPTALAFINVIATVSGVIGAFAWSRLSYYSGWSPVQTIVACIILFELIPLYGLLGYIPFIRRLGVFGLQQEWEMYVLGAIYGFVLSGLGAYCRALFGELIPPGSEAAFYALYAITDKGSSVFGPAIVGLITDRFGEIRPAFAFLAVLIAIPLPLMSWVNVDRGKAEGKALAIALERGAEADRASQGGYGSVPGEETDT
jgi:UMF1 family MFS transporter